MGLSLAVTADLHWGHRTGNPETQRLADFLHARPPDVLILAGDLGTGPHFAECLGLFADLPSRKLLIPGNHDIWVSPDEQQLDSLLLYEQVLPEIAAEMGFHYLDHGPIVLPDEGLAIVGSINWYDYSWSLSKLSEQYPAELHRLESKRFPRGRHNDANFVRWPLDDRGFTARVVECFEKQLDEALAAVPRAIVVTHHPPYRELGFPHSSVETLETLLWDAFSGNQTMEDVLTRRADRIAFIFCGHTHRERESMLGAARGFNIGSDYPFKRLLLLDWPEGKIEAHRFG